MPQQPFTLDPRYFQLLFQAFFLCYGILFLHWDAGLAQYGVIIGACLLFNYTAAGIQRKKFLPLFGGWRSWGLSILISAMGLCLLLKTDHWWTAVLAASLTVASKYLFRVGNRHIFNPSAFGIVATLTLSGDAWLSPGQWGNYTILFFLILTLGTIVVSSVQKLDISLAFLLTFAGLLYWRQVMVLGWPVDYFIHSISTGGLLLFSFFMISDPRTSPDHPVARILWAIIIAIVSFYLSAFRWKYNMPVWVLVAAAPLVPVLNRFFKARSFEWSSSALRTSFIPKFKNNVMRSFFRKVAALLILVAMISNQAMAFCGFYVSKADGTLKNKTSQVIIARDGDRNTITMFNDFRGNVRDFAMVVPVPVVLKQDDIRVVDQQIFQTLNEYSQPRLVEYFDENPCALRYKMVESRALGVAMDSDKKRDFGARAKDLGVKVEAKYIVGEYDILILGAKESSGLSTWLTENGYKIPDRANEVLEPYIRSGMKFFVVKVNETEKKKLPGNFLRPIQISFTSPRFMLPIRLGMANADGDQDMIVYGFSRKGRIECANYRTVPMPTGRNVPLFIQNNFQAFYSGLFQYQWKGEGRSVAMVEYAWDLSPDNYFKCDPCIASIPSAQDLVQAGVGWNDKVYFTRLHVRYNRSAFPQDLLFQETGNTGNFQTRYIITHPATGDLTCSAGKEYLETLKIRRKEELETLNFLTGKSYEDWDMGVRSGEENIPNEDGYSVLAGGMSDAAKITDMKKGNTILFATVGLMGLLSIAGLNRQRKKSA
jgi:hypothetical protein